MQKIELSSCLPSHYYLELICSLLAKNGYYSPISLCTKMLGSNVEFEAIIDSSRALKTTGITMHGYFYKWSVTLQDVDWNKTCLEIFGRSAMKVQNPTIMMEHLVL
jgi:hypothetical protein